MKNVQLPPFSVGAGGPSKYGDVIGGYGWIGGWWAGGRQHKILKEKQKCHYLLCM